MVESIIERVTLFFRADEMRPIRFVFVITAGVMLLSMLTGIGMGWSTLPTNMRQTADQTLLIYSKQSSEIAALAWSPDGQKIASSGQDVRIWGATTGTNSLILAAPSTNALAWSPDGHYLLTGNTTLTTWDTRTGQMGRNYLADIQHEVPGGQLMISAAAWSPDGNLIAAASMYTHMPNHQTNESVFAVDVWRAVNGQHLYSYRGQRSLVTMLRWSPDSKRLASSNGAVQIWDALTGKHTMNYSRGVSYSGIDWSPDGKWLATISRQSLDIWNANSGLLMRGIRNTENDTNVVWSPDGKRVATGQHGIHLWNALTGKMLLSHGQSVVQIISWSPDGKMIASGETESAGTQSARQVEVWAVPAM